MLFKYFCYPRRLCRSAWLGFSSQSVCLFVRSITKKRMIPKCSNLVHGMTLGYPRSDTDLGFKGQRSRLPGRLMFIQSMPNIFRTGRPPKFKLGTQTEHEDPYQRQAPWLPRSKVKVARSSDASDRCWLVSDKSLHVILYNFSELPENVLNASTTRPAFTVKNVYPTITATP